MKGRGFGDPVGEQTCPGLHWQDECEWVSCGHIDRSDAIGVRDVLDRRERLQQVRVKEGDLLFHAVPVVGVGLASLSIAIGGRQAALDRLTVTVQ